MQRERQTVSEKGERDPLFEQILLNIYFSRDFIFARQSSRPHSQYFIFRDLSSLVCTIIFTKEINWEDWEDFIYCLASLREIKVLANKRCSTINEINHYRNLNKM